MPTTHDHELVTNLATIAAQQAEQLTAARGWQSRLLLAMFWLVSISIWQRVGNLPVPVLLVANTFAGTMVLVDQIVTYIARRVAARRLTTWPAATAPERSSWDT